MALIRCSECQQTVSDKAASCPHCGAPQKGAAYKVPPQSSKAHKTGKGGCLALLGVGGLFALLAISESPKSTRQNPRAVDAAPTAAAIAAKSIPGDEDSMIGIVQQAHRAYSAAGSNQLQAGSTRPARAKSLCALMTNTGVRDWTGVVSTLSTNNDGRGVLGVRIADDLELKTWNNALSDISDLTLLQPDSPMYRAALELKEGVAVKFSGQFIRNDQDCFRESSLTMAGSMTSPSFIFRFSSIKAISN